VGLDKQLEVGLITQERHDFLVAFPSRQFTLCDAGEATIHGFVKDFEAYDANNIMLAHRSDIPPPFNATLKLAGPMFDRCFEAANQTVLDAAVVGEVLSLLGSRLDHWVNRFMQSQQARTVKSGETLVRQGDSKPDFVYLVLAGNAEVTVDGKQIALLERGSFFGEQSFLRHAPRSASVVALTPMRVLPVPGSVFLEFIEEDARDVRPRDSRGGRENVKDRLERMWTHRHLIDSAFGGRLSQNSVHALAGETVAMEVEGGAPVQVPVGDDVLVVARGMVEVLGSPTVVLRAGDVLGDVAPVNGRTHRRVVPAVARGPATVLRLPGRQFEQLLRNTPGLRKQVEDSLARHGRRLRLSREATA
jgi:CRP-like cAMP-binding protein